MGVIGSGDGGVGKTELISEFCSSDTTWKRPDVDRTGIHEETLVFEIDDEHYQVNITDFPEAERYHSILQNNLIRQLDGVVIVFSLTDPKSFQGAFDWFKEI